MMSEVRHGRACGSSCARSVARCSAKGAVHSGTTHQPPLAPTAQNCSESKAKTTSLPYSAHPPERAE